ncbi:HNH endonuclease [Bacillus infantis]|uniref:HNH endonuclease n=1 Tax=Bacillus infantis TaxID=324767 RepID=UPI003CF0276D
MSMIRGLGKFAGKAAGTVVGGPIQIAGKLTGFDLVEDIGKGVRKASEFAGDTAGQAAAGAAGTISGMLHSDPEERNRGLGEMGQAVSRTAKGAFYTAKNTLESGGEVIGGMMEGDAYRVKKGASSIVKTVAVGALAVGIVDVMDGADLADASDTDSDLGGMDAGHISTINSELAGSVHPVTGVPFEEDVVDLPGGISVAGVFPEFDARCEVHIDESLYMQSDHVHFSYANQELYQDIQDNPRLAGELGLSQHDINGLSEGTNPEGYTWHHNQEPGVLELVDEETHAATAHTGGREVWGGGSEYR